MHNFESFKKNVCFEKVIEKSPIGVVMSATSGEIFFANKTFCDFLGYSQDELYKKSLSEISAKNGIPKTFPSNLQGGSQTITFENKYIGKAQKRLFAFVKMSQVADREGSVLYNVSQIINIEDEKKKELAILQLSEERKKLASQLICAQEKERKKISQEIHDEMGQLLTALKISVSKISQKNQQSYLNEPLSQIKDLLDTSIESAKSLATRLHPAMLDHLGLLDALKHHFKQFKNIFGFEASFLHPPELPEFSEDVSISLFRIFQEALNNVLKHAKATFVIAKIEITESTLFLSIEDNGVGLRENKMQHFSLGVLGMRERIESHGGAFSLQSLESGSLLIASLPIK